MQDSVLPQGGGGAEPPRYSFLSLLSLSSLIPFIALKSLRRFVTFGEILAIFRLLKTFLSYQQVLNNAPFSTQFFEKSSVDRRIFGLFAHPC